MLQLQHTPLPQSTTPGLHPVSIHQMAPHVRGSKHLITAYYSVYRPRKDERLSRPGWLVTYWNKVPPLGVEPGHVTHPSTNRARRRVTSLVRPTPLPLRHAANRQSGRRMVDSSLNCRVVDCVVVLQLPVHKRNARQHQVVGWWTHELWGHRVQLPRRQRHRQAANQSDSEAEIPMSGMSQRHGAVCGPWRTLGGKVGVHRDVRWDLWHNATENGGLPRRPGFVPRRRPSQSQVV